MEKRQGWGLVILLAGALVELAGVAIEVWQDRDVYTIAQSITLPTYAAMIVGVPLVSRGFGVGVRTLEPSSAKIAEGTGALVGSILWVGAIWWQIRIGLPSGDNFDLDSYSAVVILFLGVALLARSVDLHLRPPQGSPVRQGVRKDTANGGTEPLADRPGRGPLLPWALIAPAILLLGVSLAFVGWLTQRATEGTPLYLVIAIELGGSGAWFLLVGYRVLLRGLTARPKRAAFIGGAVGGVALAVGGAFWWGLGVALSDVLRLVHGTAPVGGVIRWIDFLALLISGIGILVLAVINRHSSVGPD
jgi:hypothetical protein